MITMLTQMQCQEAESSIMAAHLVLHMEMKEELSSTKYTTN